MAKKLYLIDGNSFCYRAYYAIKILSNSKGFPTNAVYGFISMLRKIIQENQPDYIGVCFDMGKETFRHKKYGEYKIQRKPMPDELVQQMPVIKEVVKAYNIAIYEKSGFEADDLIGTLSKAAADKGIDTFIVTGDKDAFQLVDKSIKIYSTHKDGLIYDENEVINKYGVKPDQVVDMMALMGDTSDNIPGVKGIGEKTASELISKFGTLDNLYKNIDEVKSNAQKALLEKYKEQAYLSMELATIDTEVPLTIDFLKLQLQQPDKNRLYEIFKEMEFKSLITEYAPDEKLDTDYKMIRTEKELKELLRELLKQKEVAFDFETTGVDELTCELVGVSFCYESGHASYISFLPAGQAGEGNAKDFPSREQIMQDYRAFFENEKIKKIGQNIKYENLLLKKREIELKGISFDTMIASYLLNPSRVSHNLTDISIEYLDFKPTDIEELIGKGKHQITMDKVEPQRVCDYCCQDSDVTFRLKQLLEKKLKEKDLYELFCDIEMPLVEVLSDMEYAGVCIDKERLGDISKDMTSRLENITSQIYEAAGCEFNINSPKQLAEVLFTKLKLPIVKKTKTGISTDVEVLQKLSQKHAICSLLLEYRELSKLKSTYVDTLPLLINPQTNRVHTSFNQTVTATGRLSSSDPNLQNIPIKTKEGKKIREAFIAGDSQDLLLSADYSQIELRILAHLSEDAQLVQAFKEGSDIHRHTASLIFNCEEKDVTEAQRAQAKTVNFGIVYGMSPYGLSKELGITPEEAKVFIDAYFIKYKNVQAYIENTLEFARENKYVLTMFNRRRYIPEITSQNLNIRQFAERTAINTPIQGTAADLIKIAMIGIHNELKGKNIKSKMVLQVHDELVFDVSAKEKEALLDIIKTKMENAVKLKVPVEVSMKTAKNWAEC